MRRYLGAAFVAAAMLFGIAGFSGAEEDDRKDSLSLGLTISSLPEAQAAVNWSFTMPMLQGNNFLTRGNNLKTSVFYNIAPVSMNAGLDLILTPIAFAQIKAGASIGTGWNFPALDLAPHAWGINRPQTDGAGLIEGKPFEAVISEFYGGAVLQFDVGAVVPGDWTHLLIQVYQGFSYRANNMAGPNDSWSHENDGGENRNAPRYYGSYVLGYQFPAVPILDMAALMAEMDYNFYDTPNRHFFGDDRPLWTFSFLANAIFTKRFSATLAAQFRLDRNFIAGTEKKFYQYRELNQNNPYTLNFYRVAAIMTYKLW
jgi:hypothetical protein